MQKKRFSCLKKNPETKHRKQNETLHYPTYFVFQDMARPPRTGSGCSDWMPGLPAVDAVFVVHPNSSGSPEFFQSYQCCLRLGSATFIQNAWASLKEAGVYYPIVYCHSVGLVFYHLFYAYFLFCNINFCSKFFRSTKSPSQAFFPIILRGIHIDLIKAPGDHFTFCCLATFN